MSSEKGKRKSQVQLGNLEAKAENSGSTSLQIQESFCNERHKELSFLLSTDG